MAVPVDVEASVALAVVVVADLVVALAVLVADVDSKWVRL